MCRIAGFVGFNPNELTRAKDLIETYHSFGATRPMESWDTKDSQFSLCISRYDVTTYNRKTKDNIPFESSDHILAFNGEVYDYNGENFVDSDFKDDFEFASYFIESNGLLSFFTKADFQGTYLIFQKSSQSLFVFADHFNSAGCFYVKHDNKIIISQEFTVLYKLISEFFPSEKDKLAINILSSGSYLEINSNYDIKSHVFRKVCSELWRGEEKYFKAEESYIALNQKLEDAIKSRIPKEGTVGVLCGGGVDSSLILAKTYYILRQKNELYRLKVYTLGTSSLKDVTTDIENDLTNTIKLLEHLNLSKHAFLRIIDPPNHWYDELLDNEVFDENPRLITPNPSRTQVRHTVQLSCILATIAKEFANDNVRVLLSGDFADEIFAGYDSMFKDAKDVKQLRDIVYKKLDELPLNDAARVSLSCYYGMLRVLRKFHLEPVYKRFKESKYRNAVIDRKLNQELLLNLDVDATLKEVTDSYHPIEIRTPYLSFPFLKELKKFPPGYLVGKFILNNIDSDKISCTKFVLRKLALLNNLPNSIALRPKIPFNEGGTGIKNSQRDKKEIEQAIIYLDDESQIRRRDLVKQIKNLPNYKQIYPNELKLNENIESICLIHCAGQNGLRNVLIGNTFEKAILPSIYETSTNFFLRFIKDKNTIIENIRNTINNEDFVIKNYLNKVDYRLNLIMVKQQLMYAPLFLAVSDLLRADNNISLSIKSNDNYPEKFKDDNAVIDSLFSSKPRHDEINIYITGELDIDNYNGEKDNAILSIASIIHRLPFQFIKKKYSKFPEMGILYTFPEETTFTHYLRKIYKGVLGGKSGKKGAVKTRIKGLSKVQEVEKKVFERNAFGVVSEITRKNKIERIDAFSPPITNVPFTVLYTQRDTYLNREKRAILKKLRKRLEGSIKEMYSHLQEEVLRVYLPEDYKNTAFYTEKLKYKIQDETWFKKLLKDAPAYCLGEYDYELIIDNLIWMAKSGIWGVKSDLKKQNKNNSTFEKAIEREIKKRERSAFLKSAISNVMARGLSHAMGSHILPEYRNYYATLLGYFTQHDKDETPLDQFLLNKYTLFKDKINREFLADTKSHLTHFFNYTQQRMELIADVTMVEDGRTTFDYSLTEIFNDFKAFNSSILKGLFDSFDNLNKRSDKEIKLYSNFKNDINVYIPGGQLGISALYMVFEGFIRNYYKHALSGRTQNIYEFLFEVSEPDDEKLRSHYYCIDLVDCHGKENESQRTNDLLERLQGSVDQKIINKKNQLRQGGWGFIEMKAACAYLINYPLDFLEYKEKNINIRSREINKQIFPARLLTVGYYKVEEGKKKRISKKSGEENGEVDLGFRFYIKKPQIILIDASLLSDEQKMQLKRLQLKGVFIGKTDDFFDRRSEHEIIVTKEKVNTNQMNVVFDSSESMQINEKIGDLIWSIYGNRLDSRDMKIFKIRDNTFILNENYINAIWDTHGKNFGLKTKDLATIKNEVGRRYYHHSSKFNRFIEKRALDLNALTPALKAKIKDMLLTNISIFDERIQKEVIHQNGDQPNLSIRDTWELCNVYIPPIDKVQGSDINAIDLDKINAEIIIEAVKSRLLSGDQYIIIHYTLFEKIVPKAEEVNVFYNNLPVFFQTPDVLNRIVFTSGIRNPSSLVNDCMFLNLSTLGEVVVNNPCKYSLMNVLKSI